MVDLILLDAIATSKSRPFDVLIMQEPDRFSRRDGDESFAELKAIAKAGIEIWFYSDGSRFQAGDFASNTLGFLKGEFAAEYRRTISRKTMESHLRKAQLGHLIGGRRFGYAADHATRKVRVKMIPERPALRIRHVRCQQPDQNPMRRTLAVDPLLAPSSASMPFGVNRAP